jgi:hypothetical protein
VDDWRLQGQERYLRGRKLRWTLWSPYRPGSDHDHCEFCWSEFGSAVSDHVEFNEGYVTSDDNYHWICPNCFKDFREGFEWVVVTETDP